MTRVSDRYSIYPVAWAAVVAVLSGGLVALIRPEIASRTLILIELPVLIALTLLLDWLPLRLASYRRVSSMLARGNSRIASSTHM